jgi:hypothetical protein
VGLTGVLATTAVTVSTTETLLKNLQVAAGSAAMGDTYLIRMAGVSSSTGTLTFRVRVGALGTVAGDAQAWISTTSVAQVANAHAGLDLVLTVRAIGASGSVMVDGNAHAGAVMLPTLIGAAATAAIVSTAAWFIDVSAACSVGTFTAQILAIDKV